MQGATATNPIDGDLTAFVDACVPGHRFSTQGLAACALDTSQLGNHSLTFFLSNSRLEKSSNTATRNVIVHAVCSDEETLCNDLSCSSSGLCLNGASAANLPNSSPQLKFADGEQETVYVPHGSKYEFCNSSPAVSDSAINGTGAATHLCEMGPIAYDEEEGPISERVLACPPADCLARGCPGHELQKKGLLGCGVDTKNAPIGTTFSVTFVVFDSHRPAASASITRTVTVISPCLMSQIYCADRAVQCASVPCETRDAVDEVAILEPPEISLNLADVPSDSLQSSMSPDGIRRLELWTLCGKPPPVDFSSVCGADNQDDLARSSWHECADTVDALDCKKLAVQVTSPEGSPKPLVALIRRDLSACGNDGAACDVLCSLGAIGSGRCPTSSQSFTMHVFHAHESVADAAKHAQMLRTRTHIASALAAASLAANVSMLAPANSSAMDIETFATVAPGTPQCSNVASSVHNILRHHVDTSDSCTSFRSEALTSTTGRAILFTEIASANAIQPALRTSAAVPGDRTLVGVAEMQASITLGADSSEYTGVQGSLMQEAAVSCLESLSTVELQGQWQSGLQAEGSDEGSVVPDGRLELSIHNVSAAAAECSGRSDEELAVDAAVAAVEDSLMQQLMIDRLVCASPLVAAATQCTDTISCISVPCMMHAPVLVLEVVAQSRN